MLLRTLAVCLLVTQCTGTGQIEPSSISGPIDDLISALLEQFRDALSEPQPLPDIAVDMNEPGAITLRVNFTDSLLHDLSTFEDDVHVNMITLKLNVALSLPTLSLECNYAFGSGSVIADLFPLYGSGACSVALGGIVLTVDADLKHNMTGGHDHYQIETMDFFFHFDTLDVQLHNLFDNEDLASVIDGFADDFGPVLVDVLVNETRADLMPVIIEKLNEILWDANILQPNTADDVLISEPLKAMPMKLPVHGNLVVNHQVSHQHNFAKMNYPYQAGMPEFNAQKRQGKRM